jgi:hypothetical protein
MARDGNIIRAMLLGKVSPNVLQQLPQVIEGRFPGRQVKIVTQGLEHPNDAFSPTRKQIPGWPNS